jgi:SAM-dependent methyltransferase
VDRAEQARRHFDRRAPRYENPLTSFIGERELRALRPFIPAGRSLLDYGCGTGRVALDCLRRGCQVTAFDLSPAMLERAVRAAQHDGLGGEFVAGEAALAGRTWPLVTCVGVLDYYPDPQPLLARLAAYLAPGGTLLVTFPNALSPFGWLYALGSRFTFPARPRSPGFVRAQVARAGYRVEALRYAFPALAPVGHTLIAVLRR